MSERKSSNTLEGGESQSIEKIVGGILDEDLVASVFWDVDNRQTLRNLIMEEKRQGLRDQVSFWKLDEREKDKERENENKREKGNKIEKENKREKGNKREKENKREKGNKREKENTTEKEKEI